MVRLYLEGTILHVVYIHSMKSTCGGRGSTDTKSHQLYSSGTNEHYRCGRDACLGCLTITHDEVT